VVVGLDDAVGGAALAGDVAVKERKNSILDTLFQVEITKNQDKFPNFLLSSSFWPIFASSSAYIATSHFSCPPLRQRTNSWLAIPPERKIHNQTKLFRAGETYRSTISPFSFSILASFV
jgi:hypothetical protein